MPIVSPEFSASPPARPSLGGVRARPWQKYAVEWVKRRLRAMHRQARDAGQRSPLTEVSAHLYLLIATYVRDGGFISEPIRLQELATVMHCEAHAVTRARKTLERLGDVKRVAGGQGKAHVRFELVKMSGPLYAESGGAAATSNPQFEVTSNREFEVTSNPQFDVAQLRTDDSKYSTPDNSSIEEEEGSSSSTRTNPDRVAAFLHWWTVTYPLHNAGVHNAIRDCDRKAAIDLHAGGARSLERLQSMAVLFWTLSPADRESRISRGDLAFIASTDRSIRVLELKATVIEREVVRLGLDRSEPACVWNDIVRRCPKHGRWLQRSELLEDLDGIVRIRVPVNDLAMLRRFGLEAVIAAAVLEVLGRRRIEYVFDVEDEDATSTAAAAGGGQR